MNAVVADHRDIGEVPWMEKAEAFALKAVSAAGLDDWDLSLLFCGEEFIAGLNRQYRERDESTDVLSFTLGEWYQGENGRRYMAGDVVVCPAVSSRNAAAYGASDDEEMRRLIVHGILHLSGMDHETNDPGEPMLIRQEQLMSILSEERIF
jgi:probable rRNA maturation factor